MSLLCLQVAQASITPQGLDLVRNIRYLRAVTYDVPLYPKIRFGTDQQALAMGFGDTIPKNTAIIRNLKKEVIYSIDIVYTDFPKGQNMDTLNLQRLKALYNVWPEIFSNPLVEWRLVKQTGVYSTEQAKKAFHGIVITYREYKGFDYESKTMEAHLEHGKVVDSTVYKVFTRNNHWKKMLVVSDVTGSMQPYTSEFLLWLKLALKNNGTEQIVFFNDNDENSSENYGEKGFDLIGVWDTGSENFNKIVRKCLEAMYKGDHYENNLEALIYAIKNNPTCEEVVMIADNWEDPCDMHLLPALKALNKPIHIVVCGVNAVMNTNYLDIAYATGGTVHTMEQDLNDLVTVNEGRSVKIGHERYKIKEGKFKHITAKRGFCKLFSYLYKMRP